jgi:hypothetical protein
MGLFWMLYLYQAFRELVLSVALCWGIGIKSITYQIKTNPFPKSEKGLPEYLFGQWYDAELTD